MKFKKKTKRVVQITTSALPDIVFLLLFFFMVSATIKPKEDKMQVTIPEAKALTKVERKELVREISIGVPKNANYGEEPRIIVEDRFIDLAEIPQLILEQKESLPEVLRDQLIVVLRVDEHVKMGLISDVEEELKKVNARKVVYRTLEEF